MRSARRLLFVLPVAAAAVVLAFVLSGSAASSTKGASARAAVDQHVQPLDHFACYPITSSTFATRTVRLEDQFETKSTEVFRPTSLCSPTHKNGEEINDYRAHLVCHPIRDTQGQPPFEPKKVLVKNQFTTEGEHLMSVRSIASLCIPSLKTQAQAPPRDAPLPNISHYKCYNAAFTPTTAVPRYTARPVSLQDQFGFSRPWAQSPTLLCNPAEKTTADGKTSPITTREHLVCYPIRFQARTRHQFGDLSMKDNMRRTLCVPSEKRHLEQ